MEDGLTRSTARQSTQTKSPLTTQDTKPSVSAANNSLLSGSWKIAPVLACGDTVVLKTADWLHEWYDYYHGTNLWRYGLMLYMARVLKWDSIGEPNGHEIAFLSRLVLDSVRCCREDSKMRKQFLYLVIFAGMECSDSYSRKFVVRFFEELRQWCKYAMFKEALDLLREMWQQRDNNKTDWRVCWGSVLGTKSPHACQLLLA